MATISSISPTPLQESHLCTDCRTALNGFSSTAIWGTLHRAQIIIEETVAEGCCLCLVLFNASTYQNEQMKGVGHWEHPHTPEYSKSFLWYNRHPSAVSPDDLTMQIRFERAGGFWPVWCQINLLPMYGTLPLLRRHVCSSKL